MHALALVLALLFAAAPAAGAGQGRPLELDTAQVRLDATRPERMRAGGLEWRGGLVLTSADAAFGGLSGLVVEPDRQRVTAVGDQGIWVTARLAGDPAGRLVGLEAARIGQLADQDGRPLERKAWQDAEELSPLPDGGMLVAFEREHRLWRYLGSTEPPLAGTPEPVAAPDGLLRAPANGGAEAAAVLADGRILLFAEGLGDAATRAGFLHQDGAWHAVTLARRGGFLPTGLAQGPDGDLLLLERRGGWDVPFAARLSRIPLADVRPGARLRGEELAVLERPLAVDNLEGIAAVRGPGGGTLVYLLSDDNFAADQRTLLLAFALIE